MAAGSVLLIPVSSSPTEAHPRPAKPDHPVRGSSISTGSLTPIKSSPILNNGSPTILGKRTYEQHNGLDGQFTGLEELRGHCHFAFWHSEEYFLYIFIQKC